MRGGSRRLAVGVLFATLSLAAEGDARPLPRRFLTVRAYGMGGADLTVPRGTSNLTGNPAGLVLAGDWRADILNPRGVVSEGSLGFLSDLRRQEGGDEEDLADLLAGQLGRPHHLEAYLFPALRWSRFGVGVRAGGYADARIRNRASPVLDLVLATDIELSVAAAHAWAADRLLLGAALHLLRREGVDRTFTVPEVAEDTFEFDDYLRRSTGTAVDLGAIWRFRPPAAITRGDFLGSSHDGLAAGVDPRVGLTVEGLGDQALGGVDPLPTRLNVGASVNPRLGPLRCLVALTVVGLLEAGEGKQSTAFGRRLHLGGEISYDGWLALRAGLYQGWPSAGIGLELPYFRLDAATYAEELGPEPGDLDDRRYAVSLAVWL